jgi:hypothetical protein
VAQDRAQRQDSFARSGASASHGGQAMSGSEGGTYFLGRYRVVDEIGIGGMASVHLARMDGPGGFQRVGRHQKASTRTSSRTTPSSRCSSTRRSVAARISHPNVAHGVRARQDTRTPTGSPWSTSTASRSARSCAAPRSSGTHRCPPEIAVPHRSPTPPRACTPRTIITGPNGEQLNLVHRDVTPHNLFVTLRRHHEGRSTSASRSSASRATRTRSAGTLKGKLAYMSPEQVARRAVIDRRTDVFALGRRALGAHDRAAPLPHGQRPRHARQGAGVRRPAPERRSSEGLPRRPRDRS